MFYVEVIDGIAIVRVEDKRTLNAMDPLEASIKKWEFIVEMLHKYPYLRCGAGSTCALCKVYSVYCRGCPVSTDTGMQQCAGTPWLDWVGARDLKEKIKAAKAEVEYLKGLRCQN